MKKGLLTLSPKKVAEPSHPKEFYILTSHFYRKNSRNYQRTESEGKVCHAAQQEPLALKLFHIRTAKEE